MNCAQLSAPSPTSGWNYRQERGCNLASTFIGLLQVFQDSLPSSLAAGLEELVLSEINSPSRSQPTGDSSSVSSFSYKDMMKETQTTNQNKVRRFRGPAVLSVLYYMLRLTFLQS